MDRIRLVPKIFWMSPIFEPSAAVTSYVARGSKRWRALIRSSSVDFDASVKKRMSSLNLNRFCSTKQNAWPSSGSENSYWLMTSVNFCLRVNRSCLFGSTVAI